MTLTIRVDPTTQNHIYNPISAQGQWFNHRWGRRNYPTGIAISKKHIGFSKPDAEVHLHSVYGDPTCWEHITWAAGRYGRGLSVITYGNTSTFITKYLVNKKSNITYMIDGLHELHGKVYLGSNWDRVFDNIKRSPLCHVQFLLCDHNEHQVDELSALSIKYKFTFDFTPVNEETIPIITESGEWLYDISYAGSGLGLVRNLSTYNELRTMTKMINGKSIRNNPKIPKPNTKSVFEEDGIYISPYGESFYNRDLFELYMYMLTDDWELLDSDMGEPLYDFIASAASEIKLQL